MTVWLPYTAAPTGSSEFVRRLGQAFNDRGIPAVVQEFPHAFQYAPFLLSGASPPPGTRAVITNSWNGFGFHRRGLLAICIDHLFVLDPAMTPYKSFAQRVFHEGLLARYLKRSYRSADKVVAVSAYTAAALQARFPGTEVQVIRNGIDTEFFFPQRGPDGASAIRPFRLGFAGNHTRRKGIDLLVPIMQALGDGFELWHTGPALPDVPAAMRSKFHPQGRLGPEQMRAFYGQCDALLTPTRLEGLPLAVLEAQACGLPVVTTDCTSLPEAVRDGMTGFVCPVDDAEAMVAAVQLLAADRTRLAQMARAARERAVTEFGFDRMVDAYCALLGDAIA